MVRLLSLFKAIRKALSLPLLAAFFITAQVGIQEPFCSESQDRIQTQRAKRNSLQKEISAGQQRVRRLKAEEMEVILGMEQLSLELNQLRKRSRTTQRQLHEVHVGIETLHSRRAALAKDIKSLEAYAMRRLVAFYKLSELGVAPVLFSADSFLAMWQRRLALKRILEDDAKAWDRLRGQETRLEALSEQLAIQKLERDRLQARLREQQATLSQKATERAKLLTRIRTEKKLTLATIESLKKTSEELDEAMRSLERKHKPSSSGMAPAASRFVALKGALPKPLPGDIAAPFGAYADETHYNIRAFRSGVNIKADPHTPVQAVCNGQVVYADWFKAYGNIIILDHGDHYYTVSGQLDELFKKTGDLVRPGEIIGTVGDAGALVGTGLYFEIRHHGKPLDPVPWFEK